MTKNNQSNRLDNIDFVQDIGSETAAVYSGGAGRINDGSGDEDVVLFADRFQGSTLTLNASIGDGIRNVGFRDGRGGGGSTGFNDKASSIIIERGRWRFYEDSNYRGRRLRTLGPGRYVIGSSFNDRITSALRVG